MFKREKVLRQIDVELAYGIRDFEFTGGEPSECRDLRFYCEYVKSRSPESRIAVITNGGLHASDVWDVIDEVLISYHSGMEPVDHTVFPAGSTFAKVLKTAETARKYGVMIRTNTVVASFNVGRLGAIVDDLISSVKPEIVNFLPINLFDESEKYGMRRYIDYELARPVLKAAVDSLSEKLPETLAYIRYMPYCGMSGYEKHIVGTMQHAYDWFDWNIELSGINLLNLMDRYEDDGELLAEIRKRGAERFRNAASNVNFFYEKSDKCLKCRYFMICDGVEKTPGHELLKFIRPEPGPYVKNMLEFLENSTEVKYISKYGRKR